MSYESQNSMFEDENEQSYMGNMQEDESPSNENEDN